MPWGTIINVVAVVIGSLIGVLAGRAFPEKLKRIIFQGMGLFTLAIGALMFTKVRNPVILVFSLLIGGLIGEAVGLQEAIEAVGDRLKSSVRSTDPRFTEGMVSAFLIFCVGSMTVVGAIDEGLRGDHSLLFTKSMMDGFVSISLAAGLGIGVMFSIIPLFIFQYGITLLAIVMKDLFTLEMIDQLTALGGVLILGIGVNLLELKKIRLISLLPGIPIIAVATAIFGSLAA